MIFEKKIIFRQMTFQTFILENLSCPATFFLLKRDQSVRPSKTRVRGLMENYGKSSISEWSKY